jgi:biotin carboxyl carrier protein
MNAIRTAILRLSLLLLIPANVSAGGGHAHGPDGSHISEDFQSGGGSSAVTLSTEAAKNIGIQYLTVQAEAVTPSQTLYGRVIADPRRITIVSAPFNGEVEKIYVLPGQSVNKNDALIKVRPLQIGGETVLLKASQSGYVTELNLAKGKVFEPTDPLLVVSDLSVVLFEGDIFDLSSADDLENASACSVHTKRFSGKHFSCKVETVDASFRGNPPVGHVHASIQNKDTELKPGMTGEIHLANGAPQMMIMVPKEAVLGKFEKRFVYRKDGNTYLRTSIEAGDFLGDSVEIVNGLSAGDTIVTQGHYQLQFAKSDAAPAKEHDHDHAINPHAKGSHGHKAHSPKVHSHDHHIKDSSHKKKHTHKKHAHDHHKREHSPESHEHDHHNH